MFLVARGGRPSPSLTLVAMPLPSDRQQSKLAAIAEQSSTAPRKKLGELAAGRSQIEGKSLDNNNSSLRQRLEAASYRYTPVDNFELVRQVDQASFLSVCVCDCVYVIVLAWLCRPLHSAPQIVHVICILSANCRRFGRLRRQLRQRQRQRGSGTTSKPK